MSPREIHRIPTPAQNGLAAALFAHDGLSLMCNRVIDRFARFHPSRVVMVHLDSTAAAPPSHPECTEYAGSVECREAWALQRAALERSAEPLWHHCPNGRLCGLVPVVCQGQCRAALKLVSRDHDAEESFARQLELLDVLAENVVRADARQRTTMRADLADAANGDSVLGGAGVAPAGALTHPQVERAIAYIEGHLSDPEMSVGGVAAAVGSHPDYLAHIFSLHTGERMSRYITLQRMNLARRLLATTTWQVKRVSWACGFANPNWFSHVFHEHTGNTPANFRRAARLGP